MDNNCFNPYAFIRIFRILLKMFIIFINLLKKALKESVILLTFKVINEIINKFLLVGDKFMPEMHLKHIYV